MRAVVQRVARAEVRVDGERIAWIGAGLLVLVGVGKQDSTDDSIRLADKTSGLRIFPDEDGVMNRSVVDARGAVLVVSQFTLFGDTRRGRRPSYVDAAPPEVAEPLIAHYCDELRSFGLEVVTGRFRAHMEVESVNDGPVTILLDSARSVSRDTHRSAEE